MFRLPLFLVMCKPIKDHFLHSLHHSRRLLQPPNTLRLYRLWSLLYHLIFCKWFQSQSSCSIFRFLETRLQILISPQEFICKHLSEFYFHLPYFLHSTCQHQRPRLFLWAGRVWFLIAVRHLEGSSWCLPWWFCYTFHHPKWKFLPLNLCLH